MSVITMILGVPKSGHSQEAAREDNEIYAELMDNGLHLFSIYPGLFVWVGMCVYVLLLL